MKIEDLIYLAGYIDGEGCIEIIGTPRKCSTRIKLMNSYRPTIEWIYTTFGGSFKEAGRMSKKPMYSWYVCGQNAEDLCVDLIPYLKEKKRQAELLIEYRNLGMFSRYNPPTDDVLLKREELIKECRRLKHAEY